VTIALLLYTAKAEHDALGHAIAWATNSPSRFSHAALWRNGELVEAVWPKVRLRTGTDAQAAYDGATERIPLQARPAGQELHVWPALKQQMVGRPYSLSTLLADLIGNRLGFKLVLRVGGEVVCSTLCTMAAQALGDPRVPMFTDPASITPADLGQMFLGRRMTR